jgi:hypothetical protein
MARFALDVPLNYISRVSFQGHTVIRDRTHETISMTGCRYGARGFSPLGPPMQGGALLRSTGPQRSAPPPHTGGPPVAGPRPAAPDLPLPNPGKRCAATLPSFLRYGARDAPVCYRGCAVPDGLGQPAPAERLVCPCEGVGPATALRMSTLLLVGRLVQLKKCGVGSNSACARPRARVLPRGRSTAAARPLGGHPADRLT